MALKTKPAVKTADVVVVDAIESGYVPVRQLNGVVTGVWGKALLRTAGGELRPIKVGDVVQPGDVVLTQQNGIVELQGGPATTASVVRDAQGRPLAAPTEASDSAVGADGAGELVAGLRVARINENVAPQTLRVSFEEPLEAQRPLDPTDAETGAGGPVPSVPQADSSQIGAAEEGAPVNLGLRAPNDPQGSSASLVVIVTQLPQIGQILRADGRPLALGDRLDPAEVPGLAYAPPVDYDAGTTVGSFGYSVSNGSNTVTGGSTIVLSPVNDLPVAQPDVLSTAEDAPLRFDPRGNDSDIDGDAITITSIGGQPIGANQPVVLPQGTISLQPDGSLLFTPRADFNGSLVLNYTVSDGQGGSASAALTIAVTPVNDAPVALDDRASTPINTAVTVNVLANDSDVDGDTVRVTGAVLDNPAFGSIVVNADGTLGFKPAANLSGDVLVRYTVTDPSGATSVATLTITVGTNSAPTSLDALVAGTEDQPLVLGRGNFAYLDADVGQSLAGVRIDTLPARGTLLLGGVALSTGTLVSVADIDAGLLVFVPAANANGSAYAGFDFSVQDSAGAFDLTPNRLQIDIAPVNDAPVAQPDTASTPINVALASIDVLGNDSDGDAGTTLSVSAASLSNPALGTVGINADGTLNFTPAANVSGPVTINYTVSDGNGGSATSTLTVQVGANSAPAGRDARFTLLEDGSRSFSAADFGFADVDAGQSLAAVRIDTLPGAGLLSLSGVSVVAGQVIAVADLGNLRFVPAADANGAPYAAFTFSVQDSAGAFDGTPNTITLDVTPQPDAAVISGTSSDATQEEGPLTATGKLDVVDPDAGEAAVVAQTNVTGAHGVFSIDAAGNWRYDLDNTDPAVQALGQGQTLPNESFVVSSIDGTTRVVTVTITGTNDVPVAQAAALTVAEDAALVTGSVLATDIDVNNASLTYALVAAAPAGLVFNADGSYSFDPANAAYQSLGVGQTLTLTILYTATDDQGAVSPQANLVITITGTNDAPTLDLNAGTAGSGYSTSYTENGVAIAVVAPSVTITDIDSPLLQGATVTLVNAQPGDVLSLLGALPGGITALIAGNVLTLSGSASATDYQLALGQIGYRSTSENPSTTSRTLEISVSDGALTSNLATTTISVTAVNDAPVAVNVNASGLEDPAARIAVNLSATDADDGVAPYTIGTLPVNGTLYAAASGGVALAAGAVVSGTVYFVPNANWNGNTSFQYRAIDVAGATSNTATATIAITAVNDAPSLAGLNLPATPYTYTENAAAGITVTLIDTIVDFADIDSPDLGGGSLRVRINNVVAGEDRLSVLNQGTGANQVSVVATDVRYNFGTGAVSIGTISGGTGVADLVVSLKTTATPTAVDSLIQRIAYANASQLPNTTPRSISYTVIDGDGTANGGADTVTQTVTLNVVSRNDAPVFGALGGTRTYTEGGAALLLDNNATLADGELNLLNNWGGASLTLVRSTGANADDRFSGTGTLSLVGGNVVLGGLAVGSYSPATLTTGTLGITFSNGTTTAQATSVLRQLGYANSSESPSGSAVIRYTLSDGNSGAQGGPNTPRTVVGNVTVTLFGVNDAPTGTNATITITEDTPRTLSRADFGFVDAAGENNNFLSVLVNAPSTGTLRLNGVVVAAATTATVAQLDAGLLVYTPAFNANGNNAGSFTFQVRDDGGTANGGIDLDSSANTIAFNVTAVNDLPVMSVGTGAVTEDAGAVASGTLTISDADAGESAFQPQSAIATPYGTFSVNAAGAWSYALNSALPAVQALGVGATLTDTITVLSVDGTPTSVTITINGANDAPVAQAAAFSVAEDAAQVAGSVLATDIDANNASLTYALVAAAPAGLIFNADGSYSFDPGNAAYQSLGAGQSVVLTIPYRATDARGAASNTANLVITVTGTNDVPVAMLDTATAVEAGGVANGTAGSNPSGNVLANDTDVDAGDTKTVTAVIGAAVGVVNGSTAGSYGTLALNADGSYSYVVDNALAAVQALAVSQTLTDSFSYTVVDAAGATSTTTLAVTIEGANDTPVAANDALTVDEDAVPTTPVATLLGNDSDVDGGALAISSVQSAVNGSVALVAGNVVFTPTAGFNGPASFVYTVSDGNGGISTATVDVTVNPVNDAPGNTVPASIAVTEDQLSPLTGLSISDVDAGSAPVTVTLSVPAGSLLAATGGGVTVSGSLGSLVLIGSVADINTFLAAGQVGYLSAANASGAVTLTMTTDDGGNTGSGGALNDIDTVTLNIAPVNDAPVVGTDALTVNEDAVLTTPVATLLANDSDVDGGALTITSVQSAVNGLVALNAGNVVFTPTANFNGPASYTYTVSDGNGGTTTGTVNVTVNPVNDAPVNTLPASPLAVLEDVVTAVTGLSVADVDETGSVAVQKLATVQLSVSNGIVQVVLASGASISAGVNGSGTLTLAGSQSAINATLASLTYRGNANYAGPDTLVMTSLDSLGLIDIDSRPIVVTAVNDAPSGTNATLTILEDTQRTLGRADFGFADAAGENNNFLNVIVNVPTAGTLRLNGAVVSAATPVTVAQLDGGLLVYTPVLNANGTNIGSFTFQVRDDGGTANGGVDLDGSTNTITFNGNAVNDAPVAVNDAPLKAVVALSVAANSSVSGNAVLGDAGITGNNADSDVDSGTLSISAVVAGVAVPTNTATAIGAPVNVVGIYGSLLIAADGSYTYSINNADADTIALTQGSAVTDVFTYRASDGALTSTATITVQVGGPGQLTSVVSPPIPVAALGLRGEYYGYNDTRTGNVGDPVFENATSANRWHFDDGRATSANGGTGGANIESRFDANFVINGRNVAAGNGTVVGTNKVSSDNAIDARWIATDLDYGFSPTVDGSLGANPRTPAGSTLGPGSLRNFVGADIASLQTTTGVGNTTDAVVRNIGYAYLQGGNYDLRITADDGFSININSTEVAFFNGNQAPTAREFIGVNFVEGVNLIELLYWEQGGNARFRIEVKPSGTSSGSYSNLFSLDNYAFFQPGQQPLLTPEQDVVEGSVNRNWLIRTGGTSAGTAVDDTIRGSEARDVVNVGDGNDTLYGGAGADTLGGDDGNDALFGEAGSDVVNGGNGNDLLSGGIGSDTLAGGADNDTLIGGQGWDLLGGGAGSDTFRWVLADGGVGAGRAENPAGSTTAQFNGTTSNGSRAQDVVSDYSGALTSAGGDVLDLRDLLVGELKGAGNTVGNLEQFIDINVTGGTTSIRISTTGGFTGGTYNSAIEDQRIVLQGVDIRSSLGLLPGATEAQILVDLLTKNKLIVDGP